MKKTFLIPMSEKEARLYSFSRNVKIGIVDSQVWEDSDPSTYSDIWGDKQELTDKQADDLTAILCANNNELAIECYKSIDKNNLISFYQYNYAGEVKYRITNSDGVMYDDCLFKAPDVNYDYEFICYIDELLLNKILK